MHDKINTISKFILLLFVHIQKKKLSILVVIVETVNLKLIYLQSRPIQIRPNHATPTHITIGKNNGFLEKLFPIALPILVYDFKHFHQLHKLMTKS